MYMATIADQALYILAENRKCRTILLDTDKITWAELCRIGIKYNLKTIWITPGSEISNRIWHEEREFSGVHDAEFDISIQRQKSSNIPRFVSIKKLAGTWEQKRLVYIAIPEHDARWAEDGVDAWALADCEDPRVLLGALCYLQELGITVEFSPGFTAIELMKQMSKLHAQWTRLSDISIIPWYSESDILWYRPLTADEQHMRYLHFYDRNSMYLAACTGSELGEGEPAEVPGARFDKKLCGIWELNITKYPSGEFCPPAITGKMAVSPIVELLPGLGYEFEIKRGWIWENEGKLIKHHRTLNSWGKHLWDARQALKLDPQNRFPNDESRDVAYRMIKIISTNGLGWLDIAKERGKKSTNPWHRPDWRNQIIGLARARMLLKILAIYEQHRVWPVAVKTDAIAYASNEPNPMLAFPGLTHRKNANGELRENANELGGFKHIRTVPIGDELISLLRSGIEPGLAFKKMKKLAGGGEF